MVLGFYNDVGVLFDLSLIVWMVSCRICCGVMMVLFCDSLLLSLVGLVSRPCGYDFAGFVCNVAILFV